MDTVISLKYPKDYSRSEGARFEVHYDKARGFYGEMAEPFEVSMIDTADGGVDWISSDIVDENLGKILLLSQQGMSQRKIAGEIGINVSTVNQILQKHKPKQALQAS